MAEGISKEEFIKALKANTTIPAYARDTLIEALEKAPAKQKFDSRVKDYLDGIKNGYLEVDELMDFLEDEFGYDKSSGTFGDPEAAKEVTKKAKETTSKEAQAKADKVTEAPDIAKQTVLEGKDEPKRIVKSGGTVKAMRGGELGNPFYYKGSGRPDEIVKVGIEESADVVMPKGSTEDDLIKKVVELHKDWLTGSNLPEGLSDDQLYKLQALRDKQLTTIAGLPDDYKLEYYRPDAESSHAKTLVDFIDNAKKDKKVTLVDEWKRADVKKDVGFLYLFGDNLEDAESGVVPKRTQAVIRGLENAIGIPTRISKNEDFKPEDFEKWKELIDEQLALAEADGRPIKISKGGMATDKGKLLPAKFKEHLAIRINKLAGEELFGPDMKQGTFDQLEGYEGPAYDAQTMDRDIPIYDEDEIDRSTMGQSDDPYFDTSRDGLTLEVSSKGDEFGKQFSALNATFKEGEYAGRTIEDVWQNEIKKSGKGKPPAEGSVLFGKSLEDSKLAYQELWEMWAVENPRLIAELQDKVNEGYQLVDSFSREGTVNQAEALTNIIYNLNNEEKAIKAEDARSRQVPFEKVNASDPGPGASRAQSDNWAVRTGDNYLAAAKAEGFTIDFTTEDKGSGSTKKSGEYEPNLKIMREFPHLKGLTDEEILNATYKQIKLTKDLKFANPDEVAEIAAEVAKALNSGKTINVAGNQVYRFPGKTQNDVDRLFAQFMEMVQDNPVNDWANATIRSGGQNGFDLSGLRWAHFFKIPFRLHTGKTKLFRMIGGGDVVGDINEYIPLLQYDEDGKFNNEQLKTPKKTTSVDKATTQPKTTEKLPADTSKTLKRLRSEFENIKNSSQGIKDQWWKSLTQIERDYIKTIIEEKNVKASAAGTPDVKAVAEPDIPTRKTGQMELEHFWLNKAYNEKIPVSSIDGNSIWRRYVAYGTKVYDWETNKNNLINGRPAGTAFEPVQILRGYQKGIVLPETMADITKNPQAFIKDGQATWQRTKPGEYDPRTVQSVDKKTGEVKKVPGVEPLKLEGGSAEVKGLIQEGDIITAGFAGNAEKDVVRYINQTTDVGARPAQGLGINYGVPVKVVKAWQLPEQITEEFFETPLAKKMAESLNLTEEALKEKLMLGKKNKQGQNSMKPFNSKTFWNGWFYEVEPIELDDENYKWEEIQQKHLQADIETDTAIKNWMGHKYGIKNLAAIGGLLMRIAPIVDYGEYAYGFGVKGVNALIKQAERGFIGAQANKWIPGNMIYSKLAREVGDVRKGLLPFTRSFLGEMGTRAKITGFGGRELAKGAHTTGELFQSKIGKRVVARGATGSVAKVGAYEKYNFLYGLLSGLLLSSIESLGIIARDTIGENNIRTQLGGDYEAWAESNGILDKIGPWPLISSLERAESLGYLDEGFTEDYINQTNTKWMGVVHEFLGTEHYDQMDKINVIWQDGKRPRGWFTSFNDIFGLSSDGAIANAGILPRTGLAPAIKRSPIVSGIEIPFENWFLPKVGLESWVTEDRPATIQDEEDFANQVGQIPATVDNNAWLGNIADFGDY